MTRTPRKSASSRPEGRQLGKPRWTATGAGLDLGRTSPRRNLSIELAYGLRPLARGDAKDRGPDECQGASARGGEVDPYLDAARDVLISDVHSGTRTEFESLVGQSSRGPGCWAPELSMTFVGWGSIAPAPNLDPQVRCLNQSGGQMGCPTDPARSPGPGPPVLRWNWSEDPSMLVAGFTMGDQWVIQFNVVALGPPFGVVPVDSCITSSCLAGGSGPLGRLYSHVGYGQWENGTRIRHSLPLTELGVLSPDGGSAPAPNPPPPPPAPIGVPVHTPTPSPTPVAPLQSLLTPTSGASGISVTPIVAGILVAAGTRAAIESRSRSLRVAVKIRRGTMAGDTQTPFRGLR